MRRIKVGSMTGGVGNKGERGWDETDQGREYDGRGGGLEIRGKGGEDETDQGREYDGRGGTDWK